MTTNLPAIIEPLTPPDCDLRAYEFMPLSVVRLRDSAILSAVSGDGFRAAVILWCASWHQVPAASLPDDDAQLSRLAGYGFMVSAWKAIREEALYGFVRASDGRLYHPVIAEKALESWAKRSAFLVRSKAANDAKYGKKKPRKPKPDKALSYKEPKPRAKDSQVKGSEVKKEEGFSNENPTRARDDFPDDAFAIWFAGYPHRVGETLAARSFAAIRSDGLATFADLTNGVAAYIAAKPPDQKWLNPATWLAQGRWKDQPATEMTNGRRGSPTGSGERGTPRQDRIGTMFEGAVAAIDRARSRE